MRCVKPAIEQATRLNPFGGVATQYTSSKPSCTLKTPARPPMLQVVKTNACLMAGCATRLKWSSWPWITALSEAPAQHLQMTLRFLTNSLAPVHRLHRVPPTHWWESLLYDDSSRAGLPLSAGGLTFKIFTHLPLFKSGFYGKRKADNHHRLPGKNMCRKRQVYSHCSRAAGQEHV